MEPEERSWRIPRIRAGSLGPLTPGVLLGLAERCMREREREQTKRGISLRTLGFKALEWQARS
eukprot:15478126-Alexandrium_andersonii.AAC.1